MTEVGKPQSKNKVHGVSDRAIGGKKLTICNSFFAQGPHAVAVTENPFEVTCKACIKKIPAGAFR